ncbi:Uncharacterised protein [Salmonella enterica subsp. arizonae]|uniref:Uncharacterized protein n=1 Tax=Salmonella enterica subsp. arizonae TaxID=59203 RepID=A0A2X4TLX7_SALER|nr:Uncharacterised protein [Salmonella enterica subsp. arizonae]SUG32840.1 Uncharacterised protein [Salmonella enterica subsp. arizonae]
MEKETPHWCGSIYVIGKTAEINATLTQFLNFPFD